MSTHRRFVPILILLLVFTFMGTSIGQAQEPEPENDVLGGPVEVTWDNLSVGDVVVQGSPQEDGACSYSDFQVTTPSPNDDSTHWMAFGYDPDQCAIHVDAKWSGALEDGPTDIVDPLANYEEDLVSEQQPSFVPRGAGTNVAALRTYATYSGIPVDDIIVTLSWYYDGYGNAWTSSDNKSCGAYTGIWVIVSCTWDVQVTSGSEVRSKGNGYYYTTQPGTYYHHLYADVRGDGYGYGECISSYSGNPPDGSASYQYIQGCS